MIPVEYELARQYHYERQRDAATRRLARQATCVAQHSRAAHHLRVSSAQQLRAWIGDLLGLVRGFGTLRKSSGTTRL